MVGALLPSPRASDGAHGGPNQRGSKGDLALPPAVQGRHLLPTPVTTDAKGARNATANRAAPKPTTATTGWTLSDVAYDRAWGKYAPAIRQWEQVTGVPSPEPVELSKTYTRMLRKRLAGLDRRPVGMRGSLRPVYSLAPTFVEWLMGAPAEWVTGVPGLSREDMLRMLGNAPVPHQVAQAARLLVRIRVPA